jgi:hypothetical protein
VLLIFSVSARRESQRGKERSDLLRVEPFHLKDCTDLGTRLTCLNLARAPNPIELQMPHYVQRTLIDEPDDE